MVDGSRLRVQPTVEHDGHEPVRPRSSAGSRLAGEHRSHRPSNAAREATARSMSSVSPSAAWPNYLAGRWVDALNALPEAAGDPPPAISSSRGALAMSAMRSRLASMWSLCRASFIAVLYARREALTGPAETVKCLQWYASITSRLSMACLVALVCTRGIGRGGPEPCGLLLCRRRRLRLCVSGAFYIEPRKSRRTSQDGSLLLLSGTPRSAPASPRRRHVLMSTLARKRGRRLLMVWRSRRLLRQQLLQRGSESRAASLLAARFASRAPQLGQVPDRGALVLAREHHGCREEVPGMTNVPRHGCVGDLMALAVVSCPGDTSRSSVAEILARRNVHAVFVLDDGAAPRASWRLRFAGW